MGSERAAALAEAMMVRAVDGAVRVAEKITSRRALARTAGLSHAHISIVLGGRRKLTPEVAESIAAALEGWATNCAVAAKELRARIETARTKRAAVDAARKKFQAERGKP
jgi:DNA-binding transcriptional regulator YdaS (Cro superfamily)